MTEWLCQLTAKVKMPGNESLHTWPKTITQQYSQLIQLACDGNLYGVMLQTKDLFEEIIKLPTVMALIVIDSMGESGKSDEYLGVARKLLTQPMTMGAWHALALHIVKKRKELSIPECLAVVLKKTTILFQQPITDDIPDIVNWRNNSIGHGALRFSESESYHNELERIFYILSEYIAGNARYSANDLYSHISLSLDAAEDHLVIDGNVYSFGHFAEEIDAKTYLFESYYSNKKLTKYQSETGGQFSRRMQYFDDLYQVCFRQNKGEERIQADFVSRENDLLLECLNNPETYIKPKYIVDELLSVMDEMGKGVILMRMERGMGKTAFASRLDGLYTSKKECLIPEAVVRCYHVSNINLRGIEDYYHSFNYAFKHSYSHAEDIRESGLESVDISRSNRNTAADVARALDRYHEWYNREYTVFVIDGIDEMSQSSEEIFQTIPTRDQLGDGIFIVLLSRFEDENTVDHIANQYIEKAGCIANCTLDFRRKTPENAELIKKYILACNVLLSTDIVEKIVEKADYRMLFVKPYMVLPENAARVNNETELISHYFDWLSQFLNKKQRRMLARLSIVIALLHSVSIEEMNQYLDCFDVTYQNIGLLNDLKPLMTVSHVHRKTYYSFANVAYETFVLKKYKDDAPEVIVGVVDTIIEFVRPLWEMGSLVDKRIEKKLIELYEDLTVLSLKKAREDLYMRFRFYADVLTLVFRRAEKDEKLWGMISDPLRLDSIVVYIGQINSKYYDISGLSSSQVVDPYEYCYSLLIQYVDHKTPEYVNNCLSAYFAYLFTLKYTKALNLARSRIIHGRYNSKSSIILKNRLLKLIMSKHDISYCYWLLAVLHLDYEGNHLLKALAEADKLADYIDFRLNIEEGSSSHFTESLEWEELMEHDQTAVPQREERLLNMLIQSYLVEMEEHKAERGRDFRIDPWIEGIKRYLNIIREKGFSLTESNENAISLLKPYISKHAKSKEQRDIELLEIAIKSMDRWDQCESVDEEFSAEKILELIRPDSRWNRNAKKSMLCNSLLSLLSLRALQAIEQGNITGFLTKYHFHSMSSLINFLYCCGEEDIIQSSDVWRCWLSILFSSEIETLLGPLDNSIGGLRTLLYFIQRKKIFDDTDEFWNNIVKLWILKYDTCYFMLSYTSMQELRIKLFRDPTVDRALLPEKRQLEGKLFCTDNVIRLIYVLYHQDHNEEELKSIVQKLSEDIPQVFDQYKELPYRFQMRLQRHVLRLLYVLRLVGDEQAIKMLPPQKGEEFYNTKLVKIVENINEYYDAEDLRLPLLEVFDYYFEMKLYREAVSLCERSITDLSVIKQKVTDSRLIERLAETLTLVKALFQYIYDGTISKKELKGLALDDSHSNIICRGHFSSGESDGFEESLFEFGHDVRFELQDAVAYQNNYLESYFYSYS